MDRPKVLTAEDSSVISLLQKLWHTFHYEEGSYVLLDKVKQLLGVSEGRGREEIKITLSAFPGTKVTNRRVNGVVKSVIQNMALGKQPQTTNSNNGKLGMSIGHYQTFCIGGIPRFIQRDGFKVSLLLPESEDIEFLHFLGLNLPKCQGVDTSFKSQYYEGDIVNNRNNGQEVARRHNGRMHHSGCTGLRLYFGFGKNMCEKCYSVQELLRGRIERSSKTKSSTKHAETCNNRYLQRPALFAKLDEQKKQLPGAGRRSKAALKRKIAALTDEIDKRNVSIQGSAFYEANMPDIHAEEAPCVIHIKIEENI